MRRQLQDATRKKEEETKQARLDLETVQKKLDEEQTLRARDRQLLLQKENKIKVLEAKLGVPGGVSVTINEPAKQPESKMKQIGRITKAADAEKQVVDSIRKKPLLFGNDI